MLLCISGIESRAQELDFGALIQGVQKASKPEREPGRGVNMDAALNAIEGNMVASQARHTATAINVLDGISRSMAAQKSMAADGMRTVIGNGVKTMSSGKAAQQMENSGRTAAYDSQNSLGGPEYSTYGIDTRKAIEENRAKGRVNRYNMASLYEPGKLYAAPAGKSYIDVSRGYESHPVSGRLTSGFGWRPSFGRMHHGVDLSLATGDTVRAAYDGRVVLVSNDPDGYGRYVKVEHADGMETLYAHLLSPTVKFGQHVRAGQPIGLGGATGNATGPHLHFETRLNGVAVDPTNYFDFQRGHNPIQHNSHPKQGNSRKQVEKPAKAKNRVVKSETIATVRSNGAKPRTETYKVKRGDTLERIAREYGMTVDEICRLNKMSRHTGMYRGKVLRLK